MKSTVERVKTLVEVTVDGKLQKSTSAPDLAKGKKTSSSELRSSFGIFNEKKKTLSSLTVSSGSADKSLTIGVEELVSCMSHPASGVEVKDRKYHLKTYKKCFVGSEAVDWLVAKLNLVDREDAVSVGRELMRLQFFSHVCDDSQKFKDAYLFYKFLGNRPEKLEDLQLICSLGDLYKTASDPVQGVPVQDRKYHLRTYHNCFVGIELVDWLMNNLPLRSRAEAVRIGSNFKKRNFITHVVDENKPFKDEFLFYRFIRQSGEEGEESEEEERPVKETSLADFECMKVLGIGAFGRVLLVRYKETGQIFAMKTLLKSQVANTDRAIRNLKSERHILNNDHPFLVHLHFSFQTDDTLYLVMDYLAGGDLFFHMRRRGRFTEKEARLFAAEITLAIEHLHNFGVIYRDLKPENVLFDKEGHICLTDFGISKEIGDEKTKTLCGTPSYLAPEILKGEAYGESIDWWSLGVLILEMVTGRNPFRSKNMHQTMQWIVRKPLVFPDYLDSKTVSFIAQLLVRDPSKRLGCGVTGAREIKAHPFLKGINWSDLAVKKVKSPFKLSVKSEEDTSYFSSEFTQMDLSGVNSSANVRQQTATFDDWAHTTPLQNII